MDLQPNEYRDPDLLLEQVMAQTDLQEGDVALILVREPALDQEMEAVELLDTAWVHLEDHHLSRHLAEVARRLPITPANWGRPPTHSILTVVARSGLTVIGRHEARLLIAWRYANLNAGVYSGDLLLVTEYGWTEFMSGWGGHEPRLITT